jgi:hypothetical protein
MKYKDFFTEMSAMGHSFSAPQPDFDRYHTHNPDPHAKDSDYCEDCMQEEEGPCWKGYEMVGFKEKNGKKVPNCVPINEKELVPELVDFIDEYDVENEQDIKEFVEYMRETAGLLEEAEYQGRKVKLGKPMRGDVKKFKVYVKDPKTGNVKKVNFGDPNMKIKKSNPARRKSFRARHNCDNPGPRTKARYWSCRAW